MAIISVTERQTFKRCRRKWDLSSFSRQSLVPIINAPALDLGTIVHATLAQWTDDPSLDPNLIYSTLGAETLQRTMDIYEERIGCRPSKDEMMPTFDAIALGAQMIKNYQTHWHTPLPPGYTLIQNEQTVTIEIPNTEHLICAYCNLDVLGCPCNTRPNCCSEELHSLEATFDGVMADEHGQLFIIERKTYNSRPSEIELDDNDQFLAYMWALRQSGMGTVRGVSYDGLWKRPSPPQGRKFEDLFLRRVQQRNEQELEEFGTMLALEAMEMTNPNVAIYKTVPPLRGCFDCSTYHDLCRSMSSKPQYHTDMLLKTYIKSSHKRWRKNED